MTPIKSKLKIAKIEGKMGMTGFGVGTSNQTFVVKQELHVPLTISVIFLSRCRAFCIFPKFWLQVPLHPHKLLKKAFYCMI